MWSIAAMGLWATAQGSYIHLKAQLAQILLQSAWERTLQGEEKVKPWPWADTWPIARLRVPSHDIDVIVLAGDSARTLAFGPGFRFSSYQLGEEGNAIISAHRDTHFSFVKDLEAGESMIIQTADGSERIFKVAETQVVDEEASIILNTKEPMITLVTCYPFDDVVPGGRLRYLVFAVEQPGLLI